MLRLGCKASAEQFGPNELLEFSCKAEAVGFDSVFVSDHFQPFKHSEGHAASLPWLGAFGARTSRLIIGTSVLTPTFRNHPGVVAQAFATLAVMLAATLPIERIAKRWIVSDDPEEHVEKIKPYIDLGFRHLVFHAPGHDQHRFLDRYSERVLPKLRALNVYS